MLTSSMGLWEEPLGVRITQCPFLVYCWSITLKKVTYSKEVVFDLK
jgi:hypothetical protein